MNLTAYDIIIRPIITEKSNRHMAYNKYTFEVHPDANKVEIKKAIEEIFSVKVEKVHTVNMKPKPKRLGRFFRTLERVEKSYCHAGSRRAHRVL